MKLRAKLVLSAVAALSITFAALLAYDAVARHRAAQEVMIAIVSGRLGEAREQCEADPAAWHEPHGMHSPPPPFGGPHGPPPPHVFGERRPRPLRLWAFDAALVPASDDAPPIAEAARSAFARGDEEVIPIPMHWPPSDVAALIRTPWATGPCAWVLATGSTGDWGAVLPSGRLWLLPALVVLGAAMLVAGPMVGRIRRLTRDVERSASAAYELDVRVRGDDEVGELARAFAAASQRIRAELDAGIRREQALREFVANTTHDLMIPLTVLQGHLAALRDGPPGDAATVRAAMGEAHYIGALVHNLSIASRLELTGAVLQRSRVDLRDVVERVARRHRPIARAEEIALEFAVPAEPIEADVDVTLFEQLVSNVTYNAVRYNHPGGHVALVLEADDDDRFVLRVIDDGPGIAPEQLAQVVARGGRGDAARTRAPEGQGLGLHIAFGVAEAHGFELALGAGERAGLEVTVRGPRFSRPPP